MKTWIKAQLLKLFGMEQKAPPKLQLPPIKGERSQLEMLARTLDIEAFVNYNSNDVMGVEVSTLYPRLELYTKEMNAVSNKILNDVMIDVAWADRTLKTVALSAFLTSADGFYIDVYEAVKTFRDDVLVMCALIGKLEQASWGVREHNRRMLTRFAISLESIVQSLIAVSLELSPQP